MPNFKKDKNGKYYFVASLGFDSVTGKRIQKKRTGFPTVKKAKEAYAELVNNFSKSAYASESTMLFEEYFNTVFLPFYKSRVKERTYNNRLSTIRNTFSYFFKMKISSIQPLHVQKWQNDLAKKYSSSYVRNIHGLFQMALDRAVVLGMIPTNPAKIIGNVKKEKKKVDFWTKEEFEKVISTFYTDDYYQSFAFVVIWLLFMTGLRFGEASALQWKDIDFESRLLKVSKTLHYVNAMNYEFVEPKTRASNRTIALDDDTLKVLKEWKTKQDEKGGIDFILSYNSIPTQKHTVRHIIDRHAKLAGVHRIRIHALRHSHASFLISKGTNALLVKERLGHEDIKTTLGTYGHLYPNSSYEVADILTNSINLKLSNENLVPETKNQYTKGRL